MRKYLVALAASLVLVAGMAEAHGPSRQKTSQSVKLDATPEEVWAAVGSFSDMSWFPGVASVDAPEGNTKDGIRTVVLEDGTALTQELTKYDEAKHMISWRWTADNIEVLPATNFSTAMTVKDDGGKALVELRGAYYRGFPNNDPPPELNDEAATAAVDAYYKTGIDALVERFGAAE